MAFGKTQRRLDFLDFFITQLCRVSPDALDMHDFGEVLEGFFLTPRLVGQRIGLHPLAVIFALLAFAQVFGFIGVLVALPSSAVLLVALRHLRRAYLASAFYNRA